MKNIGCAIACTLALVATPGLAAYTAPQAENKVSVKQLSSMHDNAWVTLEGKITRRLSDDDYMFADGSGEIRVEIDHHVWQGVNAGPNDKVRISGKFDREWDLGGNEIDVKSITIIK